MKFESIKKVVGRKFFSLYIAKYINNNGEIKEYELISRDTDLEEIGLNIKSTDAVGMVVFNPDMSKILLEKEFRLACNNWVYNFPGGLINKNEKSEDAVARELKEETGLDLIEIVDKLSPAVTAVGISNETVETYIIKANGEICESDNVNEEIESGWYTKEQVKEMLKRGELFALATQRVCYMWANN